MTLTDQMIAVVDMVLLMGGWGQSLPQVEICFSSSLGGGGGGGGRYFSQFPVIGHFIGLDHAQRHIPCPGQTLSPWLSLDEPDETTALKFLLLLMKCC